MKFATLLALGGSLAAISFAMPAMAQQEAAPAAAAADNAADESGVSNDIVVTARKREESAQDVPVALNVASEADLQNRSVVNITDIQQQTPALRFSQAALNPTGVYFAARGLVVTDTRLTFDPAIGLFVDGVYIPRTVGLGASDMYDVSRVEVLKGPQGTLYGKNNTAGAINIYYNEPTDELSGKVRFRAAEHQEFSGAAVANVPFNDIAALRVVGQVLTRGGNGRNIRTGTKLGKLDSQSVRGTLRIDAAENLRATVRGDYLQADATGLAYKGGTVLQGNGLCQVVRELNGGCAIGAAGPVYTAAGLAAQPTAVAAYLANTLGSPNDANLDVDPFSHTKAWGYSLTLDYDVSDAVSLKSITGVRKVRDESAIDLDGSQFSLISYPLHVLRSRQFSQEVQLSTNLLDDRLNLLVGGYLANEKGYERTEQITLGGGAGRTINEGDVKNKTIAGFAQGTFKITDQLNFTGGLRYTRDKRFLEAFNRNNLRCLSNATAFSATFVPAQCTSGPLHAKFDAWSWTASLDYKPVEDVLLFVRADRGYRTGGLPLTGGASPSAALTPAQNQALAAATFTAVRPEYALSFEGGFKADLFDRVLRLNASYYNVKYEDLQRNSSQILPGTTAIINFIGNVAAARVQGVEADAMLRPFEGLELGGGLSYVHPKYLSYTVSNVDLSGLPFVEVPRWTYSLTAAYTVTVGDAELRGQVDYGWQGKTVTSISQNISNGVITQELPGVRPSNESLNARLSLQLDDGLGVAVFGKNLTNDQYGNFPLALHANGSLGIRTSGGVNPPRTFGVEVNAEF
jgi:iron complex outermembrane receptor protein